MPQIGSTGSFSAKRTGIALATFGLAIVLASCYPGGPTDIAQLDTVITIKDEEFDYQQNKTYFMPDTVIHLFEPGNPDSVLLTRMFDMQILNRVAANMFTFGYQRIVTLDTTNTDSIPDVVVFVQATASTNTNVYVRWPAWGWWGGWGWWGPPGWGWGYPGGGVSVVQYETGTIILDMIEPSKIDTVNKVYGVIWDASMNGVLSSNTASTSERVDRLIDQSYTQSSYLDVN